MKIYIIIEDAPLGGMEIKVMRMCEADNDGPNADTPANALAQDLEARIQAVTRQAAKLAKERREQRACLH